MHYNNNLNEAKIMKAVVKSNILPDNGIKMTLKDYYESLPKTTSPKTEFLKRVVDECGVSFGTAINWAKRGMHPADETHLPTLSKLTGIPEEELFD